MFASWIRPVGISFTRNSRPKQIDFWTLLHHFSKIMVLGVACMHCWYWVADFCKTHGIHFILGHALYQHYRLPPYPGTNQYLPP